MMEEKVKPFLTVMKHGDFLARTVPPLEVKALGLEAQSWLLLVTDSQPCMALRMRSSETTPDSA